MSIYLYVLCLIVLNIPGDFYGYRKGPGIFEAYRKGIYPVILYAHRKGIFLYIPGDFLKLS